MAATDGAITDWREALSVVMDAAAASYRELPEKLAAAEAFLRRHIAELETRQHPPSEAELDRVAQYLERVQNFGLYRRCSVNVPKLCVRPEGHGGWHISNSGTTWPDRQAPEQTYVQNPLCCDPFATFSGTVHCGKLAGHTNGHAALNEHHHVTVWGRPEQYEALPQPAPTHLSEGRLAQDGEAVCNLAAWKSIDAPSCARQRHHDGPHMDATAIAHAGKAGEVWT